MARSISATMLAAQKASGKVPYIRVVINSVDLSSRLLMVEHIEEPYRDRATLIFRNDDRYFDDFDFRGYSFQIGYGFTTGAGNEYCGDGTNDGTPTLWVKNQEIISSEGEVVCQLYCEGLWFYLRSRYAQAIAENEGAPAPLYQWTFNESSDDYTIYDLIESVLETVLGWTLETSIVGGSDGIIDVIYPRISINVSRSGGQITLDNYAEFLFELLSLTKCYLRQKAGTNWELVYPTSGDSADETYYIPQSEADDADEMVAYEYMERLSEATPNRVYVAANNPDNEDPWPIPVMLGDSGAYSGNGIEQFEIYVIPWIDNQTDANNVASAIQTRIDSEVLSGRLIIPHDCRVELHDKVKVYDGRGE
jgi:hypothetical protein